MNIAHQKTTEFINQLEILAKSIDEKKIHKYLDTEINEKEYLDVLVRDARELLKYNEWLIALENTIDNLCEIDYKLEDEVVHLITMVFESSSTTSSRIESIQHLKK